MLNDWISKNGIANMAILAITVLLLWEIIKWLTR